MQRLWRFWAMAMVFALALGSCARTKPRRKTCGLARTHDAVRSWMAGYRKNPERLRATVDSMVRRATAVVVKRLAAGGIDTRANLANSQLAQRVARCHLRGRDWDMAVRYLYLAWAVLPPGPAHRSTRAALLLELGRSLHGLRADAASALMLMRYRQLKASSPAGRARAGELLSELYQRLVRASYSARYGAALSGLPLARSLGLDRGNRLRSMDRLATELRQYEQHPGRLQGAVARLLRREMSSGAGRSCRGAGLAEKKAMYRALTKRVFTSRGAKRHRVLLMLLACVPPAAKYDRNRRNVVYLLSRSHEAQGDRRRHALYLLYYVLSAREKGEFLRSRALRQYQQLRANLDVGGKLVLRRITGSEPAGRRCPLPPLQPGKKARGTDR